MPHIKRWCGYKTGGFERKESKATAAEMRTMTKKNEVVYTHFKLHIYLVFMCNIWILPLHKMDTLHIEQKEKWQRKTKSQRRVLIRFCMRISPYVNQIWHWVNLSARFLRKRKLFIRFSASLLFNSVEERREDGERAHVSNFKTGIIALTSRRRLKNEELSTH